MTEEELKELDQKIAALQIERNRLLKAKENMEEADPFTSDNTAEIKHDRYIKMSTKLPYRWGYYCGIMSLVASIAFIIVAITEQDDPGTLVFCLCISFVYALLGIQTIRKRLWAFIVLTVLSFNPVSWTINGLYIKNRFSAYKAEIKNQSSKTSIHAHEGDMIIGNQDTMPTNQRKPTWKINHGQSIIIAITVNLIILILAYVIMNAIGNSNGYFENPISSFSDVWLGWIIYLLIAGSTNYWWFKEKKYE